MLIGEIVACPPQRKEVMVKVLKRWQKTIKESKVEGDRSTLPLTLPRGEEREALPQTRVGKV